jgi:hypothetical protein
LIETIIFTPLNDILPRSNQNYPSHPKQIDPCEDLTSVEDFIMQYGTSATDTCADTEPFDREKVDEGNYTRALNHSE